MNKMGLVHLVEQKYHPGGFGAVGEQEELRLRRDDFIRFRDNANAVCWPDLELVLGRNLPLMAREICKIGYDLLMQHRTDSIPDNVWAHNFSVDFQGHEHHCEFETGASKKLTELILSSLDITNIEPVSQYSNSSCSKSNVNKSSGRVGIVDQSFPIIKATFDAVDGSTNLLNAISQVVHQYEIGHQFDDKIFHRINALAGTCVSLSLPEYINYPFVTGYYSFRSGKTFTFHRDKFGDAGHGAVFENGRRISDIRPLPVRGSGKPKVIVSSHMCEDHGLIGVFKDSLEGYFRRYGVEIDPDGSSRCSSDELASLSENQAIMMCDVRALLNNKARVKLADISGIGMPLQSSGWLFYHTEGNKIEEIRTKRDDVEVPIDLLVINKYYMPLNLSDPNPLDAVQYARLKMLQREHRQRGLTPLLSKKAGEYRLIPTMPGSDYYSVSGRKDLIDRIIVAENELIGLRPRGRNGVDKGINGDSLDIYGRIKYDEETLDKLTKDYSVLPSERQSLAVLNNRLALALMQDKPSNSRDGDEGQNSFYPAGIESIVNEIMGLASRPELLGTEIRPYKEDEAEAKEYLEQRQQLGIIFCNLSSYHYKRALKTLDDLRKNDPEEARRIAPLLENGTMDDLERLLITKHEQERDVSSKAREFGMERYRAIFFSQKAVDTDPLNFHYLKQHAINFRLAGRIHATRLLLEEAIDLGYEFGGWHPKDYLQIHLGTFDCVPKDIADKLPIDKTRAHYQSLLDNSVEDAVAELIKLSRENNGRYGGLWERMHDSDIRDTTAIDQAKLIVNEGHAVNIDEILDLLEVRIDGLPVVAKLGAGKSRTVYKVYEDSNKDQVYAVSVYDRNETAECRERLFDAHGGPENLTELESSTLSGLSHPHLLRYYAKGFTEPIDGSQARPYLKYEFINGQNLEERCKHPGDMDKKTLLTYFIQIASAVEYLHSGSDHGHYLHRDIKLDNILVDDSGVAKLGDLQHVCPKDKSVEAHKTTTFASSRYLDPRIRENDETPADVLSDIYAFSTALFYATSGVSCPSESEDIRFDKLGDKGNIGKVVNEHITDGELNMIIRKGLRLDKDESGSEIKYDSMQEMRDDLERYKDSLHEHQLVHSVIH